MEDSISPHQLKPMAQKKEIFLSALFFFLAPSMEVPRLAAISYKRHLMNRLKHGEGIPSSAPTLQGIYRSIHYSDIVGSEEVSNRIQGHAVTTNQSWTTRINILQKILADTQQATNIYPGVFGLFKQIYIPAFWSLTASCRLETDTVAKFFTHIRT